MTMIMVMMMMIVMLKIRWLLLIITLIIYNSNACLYVCQLSGFVEARQLPSL